MKNPGGFLIFSYVVLIGAIVVSFFMLAGIDGTMNYPALLTAAGAVLIAPFIPALTLYQAFLKYRFVPILAWFNIIAGILVLGFVWYALGKVFIT